MLSHSLSCSGEGLDTPAPILKASVPARVSGMDSGGPEHLRERPDGARMDSTTLESCPLPALRDEVPIHLLGATSQIQKPAAVREQIVTKAAAFTERSKEKGGKHKASGKKNPPAISSIVQLRWQGFCYSFPRGLYILEIKSNF